MARMLSPITKLKSKRAERPKVTEHALRFGEEDEMDILPRTMQSSYRAS
jgi:hypothetical protein